MSRDFRHGQKAGKQARKGKFDTDAKDFKTPSKRQREDTLKHAVTHQDDDALEDYDEWKL